MYRLVRTIAVVFTCSLLFVACDSLDQQPKDELASDQVFQDSGLMKSFLADVYSRTGLGYGDPMPTPGVVDEALNTHDHPGEANIQSTLTPTNRGIWDSPGWRSPTDAPYQQYYWPSVYKSIRQLNLFIKKAEQTEAIPAAEKETLLGEAYFLRGYFYHNLMKLYGGVPIIEGLFELGDDLEDFQVPRNSFKETVDFIVSDLDRATERLSVEARFQGAATKGAALALKSRVLLIAASDLYDPAKSPFDMEEVKYTSGSQQDRWQKAKEAAQDVIDLGKYSLEQASSAQEYHQLAVEGWGSGMIWARFFSEDGGFEHDHSQFVSPNGYNSWSGDTPTQQHVDAYERADGSQFEWEGADPVSADEPVDAKDPYSDRDPRFKANIHFNGADWRQRLGGLRSEDPEGVIQTGWYEMPNQDGLRAGLDTREGPIQFWNGTRTGYNLRKFVDRSVEPNNEQARNPWVFLRYSEVLLNYAEASAELGQTQDALEKLNMVRSRVGMPDVPPDGGPNRTLMERIRQEREVELAFEGHRYFDVRRWMIGPEAYKDAKGIRIVGRLTDESDPEAQQLVENYYDYEYNVFSVQERAWQDKNYFLPISDSEMNRNPELVQNPGY